MAARDFDQAIERYHLAAHAFLNGDPEPYKAGFSDRDDVTLANPFGPVRRGSKEVRETMERAAANYRDGEVIGFENVSTHVTADLGYIVEVERFRARVGGAKDMAHVTLRTTSILRREEGDWKIAHRHADPITGARPAASVIAT
jgi:ketosteroid isomerase-like protein